MLRNARSVECAAPSRSTTGDEPTRPGPRGEGDEIMTDKPYPDAHVMPGASLLKPSLLWLLVLAPIAALLRHIGSAPAGIVFFCAALSIVPFAKLIVQGTEQVAVHTGSTIGGLLNATFGNLPELIITMAALRAGLLEMVRASIVG